MPTLKKKDQNQKKAIRRTIRKGGALSTLNRIEKAPNEPPTPEPTDPNRLKTDYKYDNNDLPTYGEAALSAVGEGIQKYASVPYNVGKTVGKSIEKDFGKVSESISDLKNLELRKTAERMVDKGNKGVVEPVVRAFNNTSRKWREGKAPIRLRNQELKEALDKFKGIKNEWADYHYFETLPNVRITLAERVETAWKYHKDVVRNVLNRGHAVLFSKNSSTPDKPPGMNEPEWKKWKEDKVFPNRQKWLSQVDNSVSNSLRNLTYHSRGLTYAMRETIIRPIETTTDSIQTFFQYLDYDDPEPVSQDEQKKNSLDDLQPLEPEMVSTINNSFALLLV
jgi:hypothetical protein